MNIAHAAAHGIKLYSHHLRYLGNRDGIAAPIVALTDGSLVVIGTRVTPRPGRAGLSTGAGRDRALRVARRRRARPGAARVPYYALTTKAV